MDILQAIIIGLIFCLLGAATIKLVITYMTLRAVMNVALSEHVLQCKEFQTEKSADNVLMCDSMRKQHVFIHFPLLIIAIATFFSMLVILSTEQGMVNIGLLFIFIATTASTITYLIVDALPKHLLVWYVRLLDVEFKERKKVIFEELEATRKVFEDQTLSVETKNLIAFKVELLELAIANMAAERKTIDHIKKNIVDLND